MEIIAWKIVKKEGEADWTIKLNTEEFGWIEEKKQFSSFIEAGEYLQKYYDK